MDNFVAELRGAQQAGSYLDRERLRELITSLRNDMLRAKDLVEGLRAGLLEGVTESLRMQPVAWTFGMACWNLLPREYEHPAWSEPAPFLLACLRCHPLSISCSTRFRSLGCATHMLPLKIVQWLTCSETCGQTLATQCRSW